ncbi:unnamed protein product [Boreogadus saida]
MVIKDHIAYRYEVLELMGEGTFGRVLKCRERKTKQLVAMKVIANDQRFADEAMAEVEILELLQKKDELDVANVVHMKEHVHLRTETGTGGWRQWKRPPAGQTLGRCQTELVEDAETEEQRIAAEKAAFKKAAAASADYFVKEDQRMDAALESMAAASPVLFLEVGRSAGVKPQLPSMAPRAQSLPLQGPGGPAPENPPPHQQQPRRCADMRVCVCLVDHQGVLRRRQASLPPQPEEAPTIELSPIKEASLEAHRMLSTAGGASALGVSSTDDPLTPQTGEGPLPGDPCSRETRRRLLDQAEVSSFPGYHTVEAPLPPVDMDTHLRHPNGGQY